MISKFLTQKNWILFFASASMFAFGIADNIRGPLFADLIHHFNLSNTEASMSFAVTSTFGFLGSLIIFSILKKIKLDQLLVYSLLLMAIGLFAMGLVPTYPLYLCGAALFGFSMGLLGVVQNLIVAENFKGVLQTKALSGLHGLYGLSSLLAPFLASFAPQLLGVWRGAFFIASSISVLIFCLSFFLKMKEPVVLNLAEDSELHLFEQVKPTLKKLFSLGGILAFYVAAELLVSTRLALYMREYFQMNLESSSLYVTYFFVFLLIGRLFFAVATFKYSLKTQLNFLLFLSFAMLLLGLKVHPFYLALTGLTMAPFYPLSMAYLSEQTLGQKRTFITFAIGLQNFCIIVMHVGVGYLTDLFGLFYAFGVGLVSIVIAILCLNFHSKDNSNLGLRYKQ
jgi:MFS family permease